MHWPERGAKTVMDHERGCRMNADEKSLGTNCALADKGASVIQGATYMATSGIPLVG